METTLTLEVGTRLNLNEECIGVITQATDDMIYIESEEFTGWATKQEIMEAIESAIA